MLELSVFQTCRAFHLLSDSKLLWMTLLAKLDYDQAPDVGPHVDLDSLQAKEVKQLVIRAMRNYKNWCSPTGPRITREQKVQLEPHLRAVNVFPGCRYLLVQSANQDYFGVWDITQERIIARHLCHESLIYSPHGCALLKGGKIARVAFWQDTFQVVDLDLDRGTSVLLLSWRTGVDGTYAIHMIFKIREEVVIGEAPDGYIFLLNPEVGKCARVRISANYERVCAVYP